MRDLSCYGLQLIGKKVPMHEQLAQGVSHQRKLLTQTEHAM